MTNGSTPAKDAEIDASARVGDADVSSGSTTELDETANSTTAATDRIVEADEAVAQDEAAAEDETGARSEAPDLDGSDPAEAAGDSAGAPDADGEPSGGLEAPEDEGIAEHELPLNGLRGYTTRRRP